MRFNDVDLFCKYYIQKIAGGVEWINLHIFIKSTTQCFKKKSYITIVVVGIVFIHVYRNGYITQKK